MLKSMSELKLNFVRWLLKSPDVVDLLVSAVLEDNEFEEMVSKEAGSVAETACDEMAREIERERDRNPIKADDIDGLDEFVGDEIEKQIGGNEFDQAVQSVIDAHKFDADQIDNLSGYVANEMNDTIVDRFILALDAKQIERVRSALKVQ